MICLGSKLFHILGIHKPYTSIRKYFLKGCHEYVKYISEMIDEIFRKHHKNLKNQLYLSKYMYI